VFSVWQLPTLLSFQVPCVCVYRSIVREYCVCECVVCERMAAPSTVVIPGTMCTCVCIEVLWVNIVCVSVMCASVLCVSVLCVSVLYLPVLLSSQVPCVCVRIEVLCVKMGVNIVCVSVLCVSV